MPYSKEGEELKDRFIQQYNEWYEGFYPEKGQQPAITPANPKGRGITRGAANRAMNSFISSPDEVHLDYVDNRLSKGATTKSIMGGLRGRVQKNSQGKLSDYGVTIFDELHHGQPLATYGPTLRLQNGSIRLDFFNRALDAGYNEFGDAFANLSGNSYDPRAHTGGRGGAAVGTPIKAGHGPRGEQELSVHRRGTQDPLAMDQKVYGSGAEMFADAEPILKENKLDLEIGNAADAPRRRFINAALEKEGLLPKGGDIFASGTDVNQVKAAKDFLAKREDLMIGAAKAFDPSEARKLIRKLAVGSAGAISILGTGADAAETYQRGKLATETKDPVDALQAAISGAATTMGATGVGELLGLPLEVINLIIDTARDPGSIAEGGLERRQQERREKLQSKPASAPERSNSLSVGFAEGGF